MPLTSINVPSLSKRTPRIVIRRQRVRSDCGSGRGRSSSGAVVVPIDDARHPFTFPSPIAAIASDHRPPNPSAIARQSPWPWPPAPFVTHGRRRQSCSHSGILACGAAVEITAMTTGARRNKPALEGDAVLAMIRMQRLPSLRKGVPNFARACPSKSTKRQG